MRIHNIKYITHVTLTFLYSLKMHTDWHHKALLSCRIVMQTVHTVRFFIWSIQYSTIVSKEFKELSIINICYMKQCNLTDINLVYSVKGKIKKNAKRILQNLILNLSDLCYIDYCSKSNDGRIPVALFISSAAVSVVIFMAIAATYKWRRRGRHNGTGLFFIYS